MKDIDLYGILMKFPVPGKVKTRLAKETGPERAAQYYKFFAERMMENTRPVASEYKRILFYSPAEMRDAFDKWFPTEIMLPQRGGDIGDIMANALGDLFKEGATRAVITGSDIPMLDRNIIIRAFQELQEADIVIGPAMDGGYYLIGMKTLHGAVFQNILWGAPSVFQETVDIIRSLNLTWKILDKLPDLDTIEDLRNIDPGFFQKSE